MCFLTIRAGHRTGLDATATRLGAHGPSARVPVRAARVLHDWVCVKTGHGMPPLAAATVIVRVDVCLPPPHWAEHTDHADQPLTTQLRGHACVLHG